MNMFRSAVVSLLLCSTAAIAAPATDESVKELLVVMQAQKLVNGIRAQVDSMMDNAVKQTLQGKVPTAKQQQAIDNMKNKMVAIVQEEIAWEQLEPLYLRIYKESLSEEEVIGIVAFYKTPAGQAFVEKMPLLTQKTLLEVQKISSEMGQKMQKVQKQFLADMLSTSK
ncbi:DUF2059 domain-containing protein [Curvibacter sp. CHRR-16]|uniref:DUF2059 domain-containing protein n=1 Tax=Curvibacter sp. CHRR-16 TaxID=2835872 RepID=UPI001BDA572C|nr:DUF2059 domain-containing protein [Curvibacter sp. CHRR-16]MBT0569257.1 DUF2059 domain-containing protein [Curvibacter sp. CHRR-16]